MSNSNFWNSFFKSAALRLNSFKSLNIAHAPAPLTGFVKKLPVKAPAEKTLNYADMFSKQRAKNMKPPSVTNYSTARAQWDAKKPPASTLSYGKGGKIDYAAPGKTIEESKAIGQARAKALQEKRLVNATKGGHTQPQFERAGYPKA